MSHTFGKMALSAIAIGAVAIRAMDVGRLVIGRARIRRLEIDELIVRRHHVTDTPSGAPAGCAYIATAFVRRKTKLAMTLVMAVCKEALGWTVYSRVAIGPDVLI